MAAAQKEWNRSGSFMQRPANGWIHHDAALSTPDGIVYPVKYLGKIPFAMSMRTMRFEDRTAVTREAIQLVSETVGVVDPVTRQATPLMKRTLVEDPVAMNLNVRLKISVTGLTIQVIETGEIIGTHIVPSISFATGDRPNTYERIGYIAKDQRNNRECHVFDCGSRANEIMVTIGQAFELRYKSFLAKGQRQGMQAHAPPVPPMPRAQHMPAQYDVVGEEQAPIYDQAFDTHKPVYDDMQGTYGGAGGQYADVQPEYSQGKGGQPLYDTANPVPTAGVMQTYGDTYGDAQGTYGDYGGQYAAAPNQYGGVDTYFTVGGQDEGNYGDGAYGEGTYGDASAYGQSQGTYGQAEGTYGDASTYGTK
ncbi:uncharacterized protein MONBRDRAFT_33313 [Monosiga brevicollis MX1]|uniref:PID domain-containing protein n=1 Tax=Monosiga brevicollis TaxID=81824 RepID=A9V4N6_MONBE|nr:uncharacterized protein MONBRDRAFT_33313 [Monosiga brevicollis MX1]EDQ87487.1 predicted protein [Monosiga brevicollis MX1]|eukprot:XP_001747747.1 hypothetical protein [Monosiga brevicollis MX1]